jgi:hypothetical protein
LSQGAVDKAVDVGGNHEAEEHLFHCLKSASE